MKKLQDITNLQETALQANIEYKYQLELTEKLNNHPSEFSKQTPSCPEFPE